MLDLKENMPRYIGVKNSYIHVVSDKEFSYTDLKIIKLPKEFEEISSEELITNYRYSNNELRAKKSSKSFAKTRIAFVGNYKMKCGISTYSESLWPQIAKQAADFKLFIEENDFSTGSVHDFGGEQLSKDKVSICWKRGDSLSRLVRELKDYDPDIIFIQHEFGIFPVATYWLSLMNQLSEYRVIVTMHSVFHHKDKTICEAAMPEIVVHLQGASDVLKKEKQISSKVHVIPHGSSPSDKGKLWNLYKTTNTFIQFGFGFRYKNWANSIKAVSLLKNKYPDVFFTGLFSESPFNMIEHQLYYNELMQLVETLGVQENVSLLRGYKSDEVLESFLRTNRVAVFPYTSTKEHEVFGSSGSCRIAMALGLPVITSHGNHFMDTPTIKASTPEEIAEELDKLFSSSSNIETQIKLQDEYIESTTWDKVADQYIKVFENV